MKTIYSQKEIIKIVKLNGFVYLRRHSSHEIWIRGSEKMTLVSGGGNHGTNPMIFLRLIKEFNLDVSVLKK